MSKTIGILGGMGPLATADLFRKIVLLTQADTDNDHIRVYLDSNARIPDRTAAILHGGESPLPQMEDALRNLERCGADCIVMPCNTAHHFLPQLQEKTTVPFLSMPEATARRCAEKFPGKKAGVLATRGTLEAGIYTSALEAVGVESVLPDEAQRDVLMHAIYDVVKAGRDMESCRAAFEQLLEDLTQAGAGFFILGCTELPLLWDALQPNFSAIDPTAELAKTAIAFCGYPCKQ